MYHNLDDHEVEKFNEMAPYWWDPEGICKPLHKLNPVRLGFICQQTTLADKLICDVGCGGGLLSEAMARHKGIITGLDAAQGAISVAKGHAESSQLSIQYECTTAESWALEHTHYYDIVTCFELIEHVPDPEGLIQTCAQLLKPGGYFFLSTLNRTPKSFLQAIVGAEYILRWLPKGTHDYARFLKPSEVATACRNAGLSLKVLQGISYRPLLQQFYLSQDVQVNYLLLAVKEPLF